MRIRARSNAYSICTISNRVDEQDPAQLTSFDIFTTSDNIRDNVNGKS